MQEHQAFHRMHQARALAGTMLDRLRVWQRGLSAGVLMAMAVGLLLPALGGALMLWNVRQDQALTLRQQVLNNKEEVLARVLAEPLWTFDMDGLTTVGNTALLDPEVISFRVLDLDGQALLDLKAPPRAVEHQQTLERSIVHGNTVIGLFQITVDDAVLQQELRRDRTVFLWVLLGQFVGGVALVFVALRRRVLIPVQRLMGFSKNLAAGRLETPFEALAQDEVGQLGRQLVRMRDDLLAAFNEQKAVLNNIRVGVLFVRGHRVLMANAAAEEIFASPANGLVDTHTRQLHCSDEQFDHVIRNAAAAFGLGTVAYEAELQMVRRTGEVFWAHLRGSVLNRHQLNQGSVWIVEDVSTQRQAAEQLRLSATLFDCSADGVVVTDRHHRVLKVNNAFVRLTGYELSDFADRPLSVLNSARNPPDLAQRMVRALDNGVGRWEEEVWLRKKNGDTLLALLSFSTVHDEHGQISHHVCTGQDITYKKASEHEIRFLAYHDSLTSLPNRRSLHDRLQSALQPQVGQPPYGALLLIDLDNFKILNDTRGHVMGDRLLVAVARRLQARISGQNMVARMGGDEFVVLLTGFESQADLQAQVPVVAQGLLEGLAKPYRLNVHGVAQDRHQELHHRCSASIGVAPFHAGHVSADELIKQADMAMYRAKGTGRNTVVWYAPTMQDEVVARARLEAELNTALREQQFVLYAQPQVNAAGQLLGAELLIRWQHPQQGLVPPMTFIPLAEEVGLIVPMGAWIIDQACALLAKWSRRKDFDTLTLAVNVSARQFLDEGFVPTVLDALQRHAVPPGRLKLEVTESLLLNNVDNVTRTMNRLKAHGLQFSLDDFGTGYSSLSYLQHLPFDQLKIDKSFVSALDGHTQASPIVSAIVALGQNLNMAVIAEGVETEAQRAQLAQSGCEHFQGYLFGRPAPLATFEEQACRVAL